VGGAVRDLLRGRKAKDWDLATDARPEEVIALFRRRAGSETHRSFVVPTGIKHGTVTVHFKDLSMEVTTFRSESGYSDGRRPDKVEFGSSMEEDLSRRDFTMNAAAYKLPGGPLLDPFNGQGDIKKRLIRCVGNPDERFAEDGLRPVRALRFASQLGFTVDGKALAAISGALSLTARVSPERIRDELDKIIASEKPSTALRLMEKTGLLGLLIPELAACRGIEQKGFHCFDVLDHSLLAADFAARAGMQYEVRLAGLYHDLGKTSTARTDENGIRTFYRHEKESSSQARAIFHRFRYPNAVTDKVCHLIEEHMFFYEDHWTDAAVRRFIIRCGENNLPDLYALRRCDAYATAGEEPPADFLLPLITRVDTILSQAKALSIKDLALSGKELIAHGISPGKTMGIILNELLETVIDDPGMNTREKLLEIAANINRRYT
jgi:tRNA nucleotidyltransferase/poly(A) polymerase